MTRTSPFRIVTVMADAKQMTSGARYIFLPRLPWQIHVHVSRKIYTIWCSKDMDGYIAICNIKETFPCYIHRICCIFMVLHVEYSTNVQKNCWYSIMIQCYTNYIRMLSLCESYQGKGICFMVVLISVKPKLFWLLAILKPNGFYIYPGGGTPYVMGDTYVPRFWPPFFTLAGSSTIFLGYFFSSTNTKTIFWGIKTTNS